MKVDLNKEIEEANEKIKPVEVTLIVGTIILTVFLICGELII